MNLRRMHALSQGIGGHPLACKAISSVKVRRGAGERLTKLSAPLPSNACRKKSSRMAFLHHASHELLKHAPR